MKKLPICFFPTKTVILDDNLSFLKSISLNLSDEYLSCALFSDPQQAREYICKNYNRYNWLDNYVNVIEEDSFEHRTIDFNVRDICNKIYDSNRFDTVVNLIIDYDMPGMNGLEFCKKISDVKINKILLTGVADEKIAVEAFNQKLINYYVPKHSDNKYNLLNYALKEGINNYFESISTPIIDALNLDKRSQFLLSDPIFIEIFNKIILQNKIAEYYLIGTVGNFLMLDANGESSTFFIYSEDELEAMLNIIDLKDLDPKTLYFMTKKELMLCYHDLQNIELPSANLIKKFLRETTRVMINNQNYYFVYSKNISNINQDLIVPFRSLIL